MVGVATRKTRLIVPEKTRKANLNWVVRQKRNGVSPFATRGESGLPFWFVKKRTNQVLVL